MTPSSVRRTPPSARSCKENGYATSWFGKNHNTPGFQYSSTAGPFDQWPSGMGFQYFYGFMGGETDQWTPYLFRDHTQIFPWVGKPGYNLTTDLADDAIKYMSDLNAAAPDKPFFLYYVPGGTHSPHQPTQEWIDKFKGKFDMGYEKMREQIFANQKRLGVIPANTQLTPWPDEHCRSGIRFQPCRKNSTPARRRYMPPTPPTPTMRSAASFRRSRTWASSTTRSSSTSTATTAPALKAPCPARTTSMTAYNGILDAPEALAAIALMKTGAPTRPTRTWRWHGRGRLIRPSSGPSRWRRISAGPGRAWPFRGPATSKTWAVFAPSSTMSLTSFRRSSKPPASRRRTTVNGIKQKPIEGVSMAYTFDQANANAPSKRETQYFEMVGNRAIYHDGWIAATTPPAPPWDLGTGKMPDIVNGYKWELYNIAEDYSENNDLAAKNPDKLKEMQALFLTEAAKYNVFPLDNSGFVRLLAPRPSAIAGRTVFTYTGENAGIPVGNAPSILDKDYTITAEVTIPEGGAEGMIATLGGRFGGYGLYLSQSFNWWFHERLFRRIGLVVFILGLLLVWLGQNRKWSRGKCLVTACRSSACSGCLWCLLPAWWESAEADRYSFTTSSIWSDSAGKALALSAGKHTIVFDFKYDGPGPGKGGTGVLSVDGKEVRPQDDRAHDSVAHVHRRDLRHWQRYPHAGGRLRYKVPFRFTGTIDKLNLQTRASSSCRRRTKRPPRKHSRPQRTRPRLPRRRSAMSQNHFTLSFPLKSPADAKAIAEQLPPLMPAMFKAAGRHRHDSLLALHGAEREDVAFPRRLRRRIRSAHGRSRQARGPVFDAIFQHVDNPPPTPVADQRRGFRRMDRGASGPCGESLHRLPRA